MKAHKFKHNQPTVLRGEIGVYTTIVFCEYCGLVVFDANRSHINSERQDQSMKGCPCAPEVTAAPLGE